MTNSMKSAKCATGLLANIGDEVPLHFTAFHPDYKMVDRPPTPRETLLAARELALRQGIKYVYVGNVDDQQHQSTYCPECQALLIERNWYELGEYRLHGSRCGDCGYQIAGRFDSQPGSWGRRRQPVKISDYVTESTGWTDAPSSTEGAPMQSEQTVTKTLAAAPWTEPAPLEQRAIHDAASEIVASLVQRRTTMYSQVPLGDLSNQPVLGCYVSLKRRARLRPCCGTIGGEQPLSSALITAATRTATEDVRLPPISPTELETLDLETWVLVGLRRVSAAGDARINEVEVGRHGLKIHRGHSAGLLLPGVATDHGFSSEEFLRQVCLKAGLPSSAWREDDAELFTFEGTVTRAPIAEAAIARGVREPVVPFDHVQLRQLRSLCLQNLVHLLRGSTPTYYVPGAPDGMVHGLALMLPAGEQGPLAVSQIALRSAMPLQSTLFQLVEAMAGQIRAAGTISAETLGGLDVVVLLDPAMHGTAAEPDLRGLVTARRASFVTYRNRSACMFDPDLSAQQLSRTTIEELSVASAELASVYSFEARSTGQRWRIVNRPRPTRGKEVRPPAVAGSFYPADPQALAKQVADCLAVPNVTKDRWPAAMVPHAGMMYSGKVAANVLARIEFPDTILIIGPKHTRQGADFAVAPHRTWALPGTEMQSDMKFARRLAAQVPGWELDASAHEREHGIEVELPFIAQLAPESAVVGVALGSATFEQCQAFSTALCDVLSDWPSDVLLLISSDMNHFATDLENRRLDELAMQAIETRDPQRVYQVVREHGISMCGLVPCCTVMDVLRMRGQLKTAERVAYATSADASGDTSRVVGYAGMLFG